MDNSAITLAMYFSMALVSFSLFLLIASFRGKNITDWFLMLRDLLLSLMAARYIVIALTEGQSPEWLKIIHWGLMTAVSIGLFVTLARQHILPRLHKKPKDR